jgi:hypothetical protein
MALRLQSDLILEHDCFVLLSMGYESGVAFALHCAGIWAAFCGMALFIFGVHDEEVLFSALRTIPMGLHSFA